MLRLLPLVDTPQRVVRDDIRCVPHIPEIQTFNDQVHGEPSTYEKSVLSSQNWPSLLVTMTFAVPAEPAAGVTQVISVSLATTMLVADVPSKITVAPVWKLKPHLALGAYVRFSGIE
jgi:hypothetical protein